MSLANLLLSIDSHAYKDLDHPRHSPYNQFLLLAQLPKASIGSLSLILHLPS